MRHTETNPAALRELHRLAEKLADDNPGRRVSVDRGAVWIVGADGESEFGIYSATILGPVVVVSCYDPAAETPPLHRSATGDPAAGDRCPGCGTGILNTCRTGCGALHCDCGYFSLFETDQETFGTELLDTLRRAV